MEVSILWKEADFPEGRLNSSPLGLVAEGWAMVAREDAVWRQRA